MTPNILPIFRQLNLLDELLRFCIPGKDLDVYRENMTRIGGIEGEYYKKMYVCGIKLSFRTTLSVSLPVP